MNRRWSLWFWLGMAIGLLGLIAGGCAGSAGTTVPTRTPTSRPTASPTATHTPSPTPLPVAVVVNGEPILQAEWQAETERVRAAAEALGQSLSLEDAQEQALRALVEETLLAQAAREQGLAASDEEVQQRLDALRATFADDDAWAAYLDELGYTEAELRRALARAMSAARMRDALAAQVPERAEQVRARQIFVRTQADAATVLQYLQQGVEFRTLAAQYHPTSRGDLGWFPRGVLFVPAVEEAAFQLEVGTYSQPIQVPGGYVILFVEDREPDRPLAPWARRELQRRAIADFLRQRWQQAELQWGPGVPPLSPP
ncbi:MAG: hypothetical protein GXO36_01770 [Chloroflexi bacterium]|nr:hypothetical protein [Chloroflexota bacterium]